jgi:4-amino-4-deoxy-L-arabinose transferase-like glycosyltransferase
MNLSKIFSSLKKNAFFLIIIIVAILPRFIFLNNVPNAINDDEIHYVLDAKSFILTGRDVLGQVTPFDVLLFHSPKIDPMQAELQYFLEIPVFGLMPFSLFNLILPNAIIGVLIVVLIYLITLKLFDRNTAIVAGLIAAFNPWFIFVSRTTYEAGPATLFFLCTFYVLLITKGWKILWTIPFSLLAFYSYIGTKLIFLPFMFLSILYAFLSINKKKYLKQYALLFGFSCLLALFFALQLKSYGGSARGTEILLPNNPSIVTLVNDFRNVSIPNPFMSLFENKYTTYMSILIKSTLNIFSPTYLFTNADYFFLVSGHGLFYYIDALLLIVGAVWLFMYQRKLFYFFISLILISIFPQIFHKSSIEGNFTPHIALLIPIFVISIGVGINAVLKKIKNKKHLPLFLISLGLVYLILFFNFCYFYFYKFPLQSGTFAIQDRILSKYISLGANKSTVTIFSPDPRLLFKEYIFYQNAYSGKTVGEINKSLKEKRYVFNNISFYTCNYTGLKDTSKLIISDIACAKDFGGNTVNVAQLKDSGKRYVIHHDRVCGQYNLPGYISNLKLSDFNIEKLTDKKFCETFIVSYR